MTAAAGVDPSSAGWCGTENINPGAVLRVGAPGPRPMTEPGDGLKVARGAPWSPEAFAGAVQREIVEET